MLVIYLSFIFHSSKSFEHGFWQNIKEFVFFHFFMAHWNIAPRTFSILSHSILSYIALWKKFFSKNFLLFEPAFGDVAVKKLYWTLKFSNFKWFLKTLCNFANSLIAFTYWHKAKHSKSCSWVWSCHNKIFHWN